MSWSSTESKEALRQSLLSSGGQTELQPAVEQPSFNEEERDNSFVPELDQKSLLLTEPIIREVKHFNHF